MFNKSKLNKKEAELNKKEAELIKKEDELYKKGAMVEYLNKKEAELIKKEAELKIGIEIHEKRIGNWKIVEDFRIQRIDELVNLRVEIEKLKLMAADLKKNENNLTEKILIKVEPYIDTILQNFFDSVKTNDSSTKSDQNDIP